MKRIIAICLLVSILAGACLGCKKSDTTNTLSNAESAAGSQDSSSELSSSQSDESSSPSSEQESSSSESSSSKKDDDEEETEGYKNLDCRWFTSSQITTARITDKKTGLMLQLEIPSDWVLAEVNSQTLNILRSGSKIGTLTTAALPKEDKKFEARYSYDEEKGVDANWHIAKIYESGKEQYYRMFSFKGSYDNKEYTMNISVNYTELDKKTADSMALKAETIAPERKFTPLTQTNSSKRILILGNSFIGTSKIGVFLNDMLASANNGYTANAISIGMAEVHTYLSDEQLCNQIKNGEYCYVFQCGFYSYAAIADFGEMKKACEKSNTPIVIFPAHNETEVIFNKAFETYKDVPLLNWKSKVQSLIDGGVEYFDMCEDDVHKHSKPLAGYVGAYLIYKTLFGSAPPAITANAPLTPDEVNSKLGAYKTILDATETFTGKIYQIG